MPVAESLLADALDDIAGLIEEMPESPRREALLAVVNAALAWGSDDEAWAAVRGAAERA